MTTEYCTNCGAGITVKLNKVSKGSCKDCRTPWKVVRSKANESFFMVWGWTGKVWEDLKR